MDKILREDSINVELIIKRVKGDIKEYNQLYLKFKNGFIVSIDSKFKLTPKQWGMFQGTLDDEINNKERK